MNYRKMTPEEKEARKAKTRQRLSPQQKVLQAHRLASADFYHVTIGPDRTAVICQVTPAQAKTLRNSAAYQVRMEDLTRLMDSDLQNDMEKENRRIKALVSQLVPEAIETLTEILNGPNDAMRVQACREILDRDGRMPKVSRIQSTIEDKRGIPDVEDSILAEFQEQRPN